jgi:hypothetical protein
MERFEDFLMGVVAMGHFVAGLFFLRFWRTTRERLFVMFAIAFWVLGAIRLAMIWINDPIEHNHYLYWLRFVAYVLILLAIVDKNRQR